MGMAERRLSTSLRKLKRRLAPVRRLARVDQRTDLPTGTVTFMFSDIEGSTALVAELGDDAARLFFAHADMIRAAVHQHRGVEVGTEGDSFFCVFPSASDAVAAAIATQRSLSDHPWPPGHRVRVRVGLHTGSGTLGGDDYFGLDVHRAARVGATGHGGQIVVSAATKTVVERDLPPDVAVRDLGLFRLKDLAEPEHLYDLVINGLPSDFPPLNTAAAIGPALPEPLSRFIGRASEVDDITTLVATTRLVTCTGPGGVGKTRLALQVADRVADRFDATYFVPLAPITEPDLVAPTILKALNVPPTGESAEDQLTAFLAAKRWLLILDNFEQVVDAAPVVSAILRAGSGVSILATSRTALRIAGEQEYPVPPLAVADPDEAAGIEPLLESEAVRLFIDRAQAVRPDLALDDEAVEAIADITRSLDGLPLAIELAAARVRIVAPSDLRYRMSDMLNLLTTGSRDVDERQRTLRNTISWSYQLLTVSQQHLLEDLSVFRAGATLDAIAAACGARSEDWEWLDDLDSLVGHSLIDRPETSSESRFVLLETIREFAAERLEDRGATAVVSERHLAWFLELAEQAAENLKTVDQGTWLAVLDRERDNLRGAISWATRTGDTERASRLVLALWRYWHMRGPIAEGAARAREVLRMEGLTDDDRLRALEAAGGLAWWVGDMNAASSHYLEALDLSRTVGNDESLANALYNAGLAMSFKSPGNGTSYLAEGLAIAEASGNTQAASQCRWGLSSVYQFEHDFDRAREELVIALAGFQSTEDVFMTNWTLRDLGSVEMVLNRLDDADDHLSAALRFFSSTGDVSGTLGLLRDRARLFAMHGDTDRALRLIGAADEHERKAGLDLGQFELEALGVEDPLVVTDEAAAERFKCEGRSWSIDEAVAHALGSG
jgi:predicted ATPase/class 3 adenylate cyclase